MYLVGLDSHSGAAGSTKHRECFFGMVIYIHRLNQPQRQSQANIFMHLVAPRGFDAFRLRCRHGGNDDDGGDEIRLNDDHQNWSENGGDYYSNQKLRFLLLLRIC